MAREGVLGAWSRLNLVTRIVIGLVLATFLLEGGHWLRDVAVARGLRASRTS